MRAFLDAFREMLVAMRGRLRVLSLRFARYSRVEANGSRGAAEASAPVVVPQGIPAEAAPPTTSGGGAESPTDRTPRVTSEAGATAAAETTSPDGIPTSHLPIKPIDLDGESAVPSDRFAVESPLEPEAPGPDGRWPESAEAERESGTAATDRGSEKLATVAAHRETEASTEEGRAVVPPPASPGTRDDQGPAPTVTSGTSATTDSAEASPTGLRDLGGYAGDRPVASVEVVAALEPAWTAGKEPVLEATIDAPATLDLGDVIESPAVRTGVQGSSLDRTAPKYVTSVESPQSARAGSEAEVALPEFGSSTLEPSLPVEHGRDETSDQEPALGAAPPPVETHRNHAPGEAGVAHVTVEVSRGPTDAGESASSPDVAPEVACDGDAAPPSDPEASELALGHEGAEALVDGDERNGSHPNGDKLQDASGAGAMEAATHDRAPEDAPSILCGSSPRHPEKSGPSGAATRPVDSRRIRMDREDLGRAAVVSAPALDDAGYILWNRALANHCLLGDEVDEVLYLTITPTILAAALSQVQPGRLLAEDAEAAFVQSVAAVYRGRVLGHRQRLRTLRRCGADGLPDCIAFLAASVLAAYQMRSDEEASATAYYSRLAELFTTDISGGHPRGFDPDEFEALWHFLGAWLRTEKGRRLALPGPDVGLRRFVALPLTHVPLRRVDIERLPEFFAWAGYEPGARIARAKLDQDLLSWSLGRTPFTSAGMAALRDERRAAVLAQIVHELESWDGAHTDSLGRRSGRVEILLDIVQRRPELFYLARRPAAFPQIFDDGVHGFEASEEGWYDPVPLGSEDGPALSEGFEWQVIAGRMRLVLRRPGARAIALPASHEYTGYLSHRALQLGAPAAALCRETLSQPASEYLSEISQQRCVPINLPGLPEGWRLFTGVKPRRREATPPAGLEALAVEAAVDLIPTGGLRLGGRWAWVMGAPPRLIVAGLEVGETVTIDGEPVIVADDGTLDGNGALARPGVHIVEAAGLRRRVEITEPQVQGQPWKTLPPRSVLGLPRGYWTLVGAVPGEVAVPMLRSPTGVLASCPFRPVWAIEAGGGPGARVLCLLLPAPPPTRVPRSTPNGPGRRRLAWASAIYNAVIRRPQIATVDGQTCRPDDRVVWAEYARVARALKRQGRQARR